MQSRVGAPSDTSRHVSHPTPREQRCGGDPFAEPLTSTGGRAGRAGTTRRCSRRLRNGYREARVAGQAKARLPSTRHRVGRRCRRGPFPHLRERASAAATLRVLAFSSRLEVSAPQLPTPARFVVAYAARLRLVDLGDPRRIFQRPRFIVGSETDRPPGTPRSRRSLCHSSSRAAMKRHGYEATRSFERMSS